MKSNLLLAVALMLVSLLAFSCRDKDDKGEGEQPAAAESAAPAANEPTKEGAGAPDDEGADEADEGEDEEP